MQSSPSRPRRSPLRRLADTIGLVLIASVLAYGWWQVQGQRLTERLIAEKGSSAGSAVDTTSPAQAKRAERTSERDSIPEQERASYGHLGEPPPPRATYPHIEPSKGAEIGEVTFVFRFEGDKYRVRIDVDDGLYWGAVEDERFMSRPDDETDADFHEDYTRFLVQDELQAPLISEVCRQLRKQAKRAGLDRDRYAEFIGKYVQSMPYDFAKLEADDRTTRFPIQTIVDRTGVCDDKSLLMVALLAHEGYDVAVLRFDSENHMAVGIKGPGDDYPGSGYLFVESTAQNYLSDIPERLVGDIRLTSEATVIPVGTGTIEYGAAEEVARIVAARESARAASEKLQADASRQQLTQAQADAVNAQLRQAYESQFRLQAIQGKEQQRLDRLDAARWIEKNCWWN